MVEKVDTVNNTCLYKVDGAENELTKPWNAEDRSRFSLALRDNGRCDGIPSGKLFANAAREMTTFTEAQMYF